MVLKQQILDQVNEQVRQVLKNNPLQDIEKNIKGILTAIFNKLDLVTREEFDIQQQVLLATRKKLEELEAQVKGILSGGVS